MLTIYLLRSDNEQYEQSSSFTPRPRCRHSENLQCRVR